MKTFRGYVSKAQEGILSENPESREYDSTPTLGEARDRARVNTLAWSLREEDMGEKGAGPASSAGLDLVQGHEPPKEDVSGPFADMPSIPAGGFEGPGPKGGRGLFSTRSLLIALVVNLCLIAAFLFVLKLERGSNEVVIYIDLADAPERPAAVEAPDAADSGEAELLVPEAVEAAGEPGEPVQEEPSQKVPAAAGR